MRFPVTFPQAGGLNHIFLSAYNEWLAEQVMASSTRRIYFSRIKQFLIFLEYADLSHRSLTDASDLNSLMRIYLTFLKQSRKGSSTVNANAIALKSFSQFLGIETKLRREKCYGKKQKILTPHEQEKLLRVIEQQESSRDKAIALVLIASGLRIGEFVALTIENVGTGSGFLCLNSGVQIPLSEDAKLALNQWLKDREKLVVDQVESGLWLTQKGTRLTVAGMTNVISRIGWQAKLEISAEVTRRTWLTNATSSLSQTSLALKFGGYVSKSTIKRYNTT